MIGPVAFLSPWLLLGLLALPLLWLLLRAVPPAPVRRRFPGTALLLGLRDDDAVRDRTPWWLMLIRMLAVAALITGLAGPVLNPDSRKGADTTLPLLIALDASWASARDRTGAEAELRAILDGAGRMARPVAVLRLTAPEPPVFRTADSWIPLIPTLADLPWEPQDTDWDKLLGADPFETLWLADGLARDSRDALLARLRRHGPVTALQTSRPLLVLDPVVLDDKGLLTLRVRRPVPGEAADVTVNGIGNDPSGVMRVLGSQTLSLAAGATEAVMSLSLPGEIRARIARFEIAGAGHAGAVSLSADSLRRREVALIAARDDREGAELLSPLHYLEQALAPSSELLHGGLPDVLPANPDVIVLADVAQVTGTTATALRDWVGAGGTLLRFAGPRLAASDLSRRDEDPLMPVRLRAGGRTVGGAMSWGEPRRLAPFDPDSPFHGLAIPDDVTVSAQVLAQPDPALETRVIARLGDGTPLVTRKPVGAGQVVLFHVTANADWSSLPLSGLFVQMLGRLSVATPEDTPDAAELQGTTWQPVEVLTADGRLDKAVNLPGVDGAMLLQSPPGPGTPPGIYQSAERLIARNVITADTPLSPARWPAGVAQRGFGGPGETPLGGWLLALALLLLAGDVVATLLLSGRLGPGSRRRAATAIVLTALALLPLAPHPARADKAQEAGDTVVLAHVLTGNAEVDGIAQEGLAGLSQILWQRTSVEPAAPAGVDLEQDELAVYPLLYWPVTPEQALPSAGAYVRLNTYLRTGGMIVFDTRDADMAGAGVSTAAAARLRTLAAPLDIPPLEPVPADHVLTRTFYLLQDFPGRHAGQRVWIEAAPPDADQNEGVPFRTLNDGVSPVLMGGNDWAAAWALDGRGLPRYRVGSGYDGERQRELAWRFGVNLVMYVLTGNYKSDQVHVPALLERLGQ